MVLENMLFNLHPDGKLEVKFICDDCHKVMDHPSYVDVLDEDMPWRNNYLCHECYVKILKGMKHLNTQKLLRTTH